MALVSLTTAYLTQQGSSDMLVSPRTVGAYALGTRQLIAYAQTQAINLLRPDRHASRRYRALRWAGANDADPFKDVRVPRDPTPGLIKRPPTLRTNSTMSSSRPTCRASSCCFSPHTVDYASARHCPALG
ncbi:hypothetical protein [Deinococcus sp.]|uniref:hypothetical protein n=1 Tax=Deinococcus sp. TaxID=47478 RepID=UPI003B5C9E84